MSIRKAAEGPRRYEGMFLVESGLAAKDWDAVEAKLKDLVVRHGGKILVAGRWDERKLSYEIRGARRATYWLCYFEAGGDTVTQMRRDTGLADFVLRCMIVAIDKGEEMPADVTARRTTVAIGEEADAARAPAEAR
jgi:small subunit ribosomal protein S6